MSKIKSPELKVEKTIAKSKMPEISSVKNVLIDQLRDLYSAETQIADALPKMVKAANSPDLKSGFEHHLAQTKKQIERLETICEKLKEKPTGKKCQATAGLVKEGGEAIEEDASPEMKDLLIIGAARRIEHYEMAAYSFAYDLAKDLGLVEELKLLKETLDEESATDKILIKASHITLEKSR